MTNYTLSNAVGCCATCNYMKLDAEPNEWIAQMRKIANHCVQ